MYLSNRDMKWAILCGKLIVDPPPDHFGTGYDETSIDLHLDSITNGARVWDIKGYKEKVKGRGAHRHAELELGSFEWEAIAGDYLMAVEPEAQKEEEANTGRHGPC